jgi:hypothetical protein
MAIDIGALQRDHPTWNIVRAITAPNGGIWALGRDGGVFSLNAQGGTDGTVAPFFGSYTQHPEWGAGTAARYFVDIQADPNTGGYTLVSNQPGQTYNFAGDRPVEQKVDTTTTEPTKPTEFADTEMQGLDADLRDLGLGPIVDRAWTYYKDPAGGAGDATATLRWVETQPEYEAHFPGMAELKKQGRVTTPAQWNTYFNNIQAQAVSAGLPPGMITRDDIGKMMVGNVSPLEAAGRIDAAGQSKFNADPAIIAKLRGWGVTDGDLTAFYLDPDKAMPLIERKAIVEQGRISVAGGGYGYDISRPEAVQLQQWGVTEGEAETGFETLAELHPLFASTVEETMAGEEITESEQLAAQFGQSGEAKEEISTRRKRRTAQFQGGGGAATGGAGKQGIGGAGQ